MPPTPVPQDLALLPHLHPGIQPCCHTTLRVLSTPALQDVAPRDLQLTSPLGRQWKGFSCLVRKPESEVVTVLFKISLSFWGATVGIAHTLASVLRNDFWRAQEDPMPYRVSNLGRSLACHASLLSFFAPGSAVVLCSYGPCLCQS